jgi:hypothetical protein
LILKNAGVTLAEELKGINLKKYLLAEASDGYQVVFSLAEVDPAFTGCKIILANRKDGSYYLLRKGLFTSSSRVKRKDREAPDRSSP